MASITRTTRRKHEAQGFPEAIGGGFVLDIILPETDPDLVDFEIDPGWAIAAGADPMAYFEKYPGRFSLFHVKDLEKENQPCVVGKAKVAFAPIFAKSGLAGAKYHIVEQDRAPDPVVNIASSTRYLKQLAF